MHVSKVKWSFSFTCQWSNTFIKMSNWFVGCFRFLKWSLILYHLLGNCPCNCISSWSRSMWVEHTHPHNLARACAQLQFRYFKYFPPLSISTSMYKCLHQVWGHSRYWCPIAVTLDANTFLSDWSSWHE